MWKNDIGENIFTKTHDDVCTYMCVCVYVCRGGIHRGICCSWFILRKFVRHNLRPTIGVLQKLTKNSHSDTLQTSRAIFSNSSLNLASETSWCEANQFIEDSFFHISVP